jgi:curved DNA-binding protein CbpA
VSPEDAPAAAEAYLTLAWTYLQRGGDEWGRAQYFLKFAASADPTVVRGPLHAELVDEARRQEEAARKRDEPKDLYSLLGVAKDATLREIKRAYRALALKWHPDKWRQIRRKGTEEAQASGEGHVGPDGAEIPGETEAAPTDNRGFTFEQFNEMFISIAEAYDVLGNPEKRALYDEGLDPRSGHGKQRYEQRRWESENGRRRGQRRDSSGHSQRASGSGDRGFAQSESDARRDERRRRRAKPERFHHEYDEEAYRRGGWQEAWRRSSRTGRRERVRVNVDRLEERRRPKAGNTCPRAHFCIQRRLQPKPRAPARVKLGKRNGFPVGGSASVDSAQPRGVRVEIEFTRPRTGGPVPTVFFAVEGIPESTEARCAAFTTSVPQEGGRGWIVVEGLAPGTRYSDMSVLACSTPVPKRSAAPLPGFTQNEGSARHSRSPDAPTLNSSRSRPRDGAQGENMCMHFDVQECSMPVKLPPFVTRARPLSGNVNDGTLDGGGWELVRRVAPPEGAQQDGLTREGVEFAASPLGLGIKLGGEGRRQIVVSSVRGGSHAAQAGVHEGWILVTVAGRPLDGVGFDEVRGMLSRASFPLRLVFLRPAPAVRWHPARDNLRGNAPAFGRGLMGGAAASAGAAAAAEAARTNARVEVPFLDPLSTESFSLNWEGAPWTEVLLATGDGERFIIVRRNLLEASGCLEPGGRRADHEPAIRLRAEASHERPFPHPITCRRTADAAGDHRGPFLSIDESTEDEDGEEVPGIETLYGEGGARARSAVELRLFIRHGGFNVWLRNETTDADVDSNGENEPADTHKPRTFASPFAPQNCVWQKHWQRWGPCSKECGGGLQERRKRLRRPARFGGQCDEADTSGEWVQRQRCNAQPCAPGMGKEEVLW